MTVGVVRYDPDSGEIEEVRHEADHDYQPGPDEIVPGPGTDWRAVYAGRRKVDPGTESLVDDPDAAFKRPGVVDDSTAELISEEYRAAGADAIQAEQNGNAAAFMQATIKMHYLTYVALTGDRIDSVESTYFGGGA